MTWLPPCYLLLLLPPQEIGLAFAFVPPPVTEAPTATGSPAVYMMGARKRKPIRAKWITPDAQQADDEELAAMLAMF